MERGCAQVAGALGFCASGILLLCLERDTGHAVERCMHTEQKQGGTEGGIERERGREREIGG